MIDSLHIQNFQSHKDSVLVFHEGVNTIIGESNSGKTAILRASRWVFENKPNGDTFRSHWGGDTCATLGADDFLIHRYRNKKENGYMVEQGNDTSTFTALRGEVPDTISHLLDTTSVNSQNQLSAPFMLSETPGEVARQLNKIVNLDSIDVALKSIESDRRKINGYVSQTEQLIKDLDGQLKDYSDLPNREAEVEEIERWNASLSKTIKKYDVLENLTADVIIQKKELTEIPDLSGAIKKIEKIEKRQSTLKNRVCTFTSLRAVVQALQTEEERLHLISNLLNATEAVSVIEEEQEQSTNLKINRDGLQYMLSVIDHNVNEAKRLTTEINKLEEQYHELMPNECPLCGQEIE